MVSSAVDDAAGDYVADTEDDVDRTIDASRTFLGPNASYFDERWRWMDWTNSKFSWNWAAALTLGVWAAYRRMHLTALLIGAWVALAVFAAINAFPLIILGVVQIALMVALGFFGNTLYLRHFQRCLTRVLKRYDTPEERESNLARLGGTSPVAATAVAAAIAVAVTLVVRLTIPDIAFDWL